jgi:hypothetical protein
MEEMAATMGLTGGIMVNERIESMMEDPNDLRPRSSAALTGNATRAGSTCVTTKAVPKHPSAISPT